jgi:hypothetical protein
VPAPRKRREKNVSLERSSYSPLSFQFFLSTSRPSNDGGAARHFRFELVCTARVDAQAAKPLLSELIFRQHARHRVPLKTIFFFTGKSKPSEHTWEAQE